MKSRENSGLALATAIRAGSLKKQDALQHCISKIAAREDEVRAFAHIDLDQSKNALDTAVAPLFGLPVGIKDIIDTFGMPTECGSPIYKGRMPSSDAPIVSMIRRAGGLILGKTVTTEFAFASPGPTTNPHDRTRTPGGSSSGSAAAVAAGFVPFAVGTQTAGSVLRPAAYCGVAGYKPSFGLLPTAKVKLFSWSLDTLGLFGAHVEDVAFFAEAITGRRLAISASPAWKPRIGIARTNTWDELSSSMESAVATARKRAAKGGTVIKDMILPGIFEEAQRAQKVIQDYEFARALAFEFDNHQHELSQRLQDALSVGLEIPTETYVQAQRIAREARAALDPIFRTVDVLLAPSASGAAPEGLHSTGSANMCRLWTLLGTPCVNVPGMMDENRLPLGLQVIAPFGADDLVLRAGAWLEEALAQT